MAGPPSSDAVRPGSAGARALAGVLALLPRCGALPPETWRHRHRGVTALLWLHVLALSVIGALRGVEPSAVVVSAAWSPCWRRVLASPGGW